MAQSTCRIVDTKIAVQKKKFELRKIVDKISDLVNSVCVCVCICTHTHTLFTIYMKDIVGQWEKVNKESP